MVSTAATAAPIIQLVPGTAVLLNQSGSGGGGSGGNDKSTSSSTNIFSPAVYVDYKRFGGEPTVTVDRYPFPVPNSDKAKQCPGGYTSTKCFKDIVYQSAPQGVVYPHYSQFWKSDDLAQTFRKPQQFPIHGGEFLNLGGGGDSHQVVGHATHKVYYVDLPLHCVTMNVSSDLGETFTSDKLGCGLNPGLDDRQWVEEDETLPATAAQGGNVYVSFINFVNLVTPTLSLARSQKGAAPGTFATDSPCNTLTLSAGSPLLAPAADHEPTPCPDPGDPGLFVAGPVTADKSPASPHRHDVYIPFIRFEEGDWLLYIAKSEAEVPGQSGGTSWTRHLVANLGPNTDPVNIFPQLTIDRRGNLYYTWSQTEQAPDDAEPSNFGGEQDVYYSFSTGGGLTGTWSPPINVTKENNASAIFPWMVAGDPGRVDLVFYRANSGVNSNVAFIDDNGNACEEGTEGCRPNPAVWNVYFAQSLNALNLGSDFKSVQVSTQPNHIGPICTAGLACEQQGGNRNLLDFFTVDIDHLGAAHIAYSDDNNQNQFTRDRTTRQISGVSVFKNQTINLMNIWPIRDHAVFDRAGDVYDAASLPKGPCLGMDVLKTTAERKDDKITITMTLNSAPTREKAIACGVEASSGGIWGAEFWAAATGINAPAENFYIAYRDDLANGQRVEGGTVDGINIAFTSSEFRPRTTTGTLSGDCFPDVGPPASGTCTIAMTVPASSLGITPGNGLYNITGLSAYYFGGPRAPFTNLILGNSEQADATAALHFLGSGTP